MSKLPDYYAEEDDARTRNRQRWLCAIFAVEVAVGEFVLGRQTKRR